MAVNNKIYMPSCVYVCSVGRNDVDIYTVPYTLAMSSRLTFAWLGHTLQGCFTAGEHQFD